MVTLKGKPLALKGTFPQKGSEAPDFDLVDSELQDRSLSDFKGKKKDHLDCSQLRHADMFYFYKKAQ